MAKREVKANARVDLGAFEANLEEYLTHLSVERGLSSASVEAYGRDLRDYLGFLQLAHVVDIDDIGHEDIAA